MKTLTLKVKVAFSPEVLAKACRDHGESCGDIFFGTKACPFAGAACPLTGSDKSCKHTTAEDWEQVLQDEETEPEPEYHFGDRVTVEGMQAVFVRYKDTKHECACIVFEGSDLLTVRRVATLDAGWE
jgi:hypothetical protein